MTDGAGMLILVFLVFAIAVGGMVYDKIRGRYPRDWRD
jgi:hypothetical protein